MTEKPCDCEVCASPGETVRMAREMANALVVVGRPVAADQMRALLHLLDQRPEATAARAVDAKWRDAVDAVRADFAHGMTGYQLTVAGITLDALLRRMGDK